uniref:Uncharacterized protein n=1 Tax=Tanacetum cinerariifolium TaxID=118510 RepID=A0A699JCM6_TANCI|nr:hypothetical protein [Tanacetum cinerariifolium]
MEQYLAHTDYALWEVILNDNSAVQMSKDEVGNEIEVPHVTAHQILARTRETKAKSTLLMAIPDEHLARFHRIRDAKTFWVAIKTRFDEGLNKGYDRFQRLLSLLEIHRLDIDTLDIDDLYNNLKVYEDDIKGSSESSLNSQNVAFVSAESTSSTNELNADYSISTATGHSCQEQGYDSQFNKKEVLDIKEEEVTETMFDNRSSDEENGIANDRFKKVEGYHAVPPPLTGNYMPPKPDLVFTPEPIPAKIDFVKAGDFIKHVKPVESVKHVKLVTPVKTAKQTEKTKNFSSSPKVDRKNRMAKKSALPTNVGKGTGHRESRPVWNNVQRINHQNKFTPIAVFTRSGRIPVSAAKPKDAASTSAAKPVDTARPK